MNKSNLYQQVDHLHQKAKFTFIKQSRKDPYGTSIPVLLAKEHLEQEEAFLYLTGDDFIFFSDPERSLIKDLINTYNSHPIATAISCIQMPEENLSQYGVARVEEQDGVKLLVEFVEKPKKGEAPSNLANISKYILTPQVFPLIESQQPDQTSGEYYITDIILQLAKKKQVTVHTTSGHYLNAGDPVNWLKANIRVASRKPELKKEVMELIKKL